MRPIKSSSLWQMPVALALAVAFIVLQASLESSSARRSEVADSGRAPTVGSHLRGPARVIDGDTIDVGGTRVRLEGIDAPEAGQMCARRVLGSWACGDAATNFLRRLVEGRQVACQEAGRDRFGRVLAVCTVGETEINAALVREGLAWAFVRYSTRYVEIENEARIARRGIFATENTPAWDYRAGSWARAERDQPVPEGCVIKGNAGRNGLVYHMPWSPWYGRVSMKGAGSGNTPSSSGKHWFCSEAEAIAAGYRAAMVN